MHDLPAQMLVINKSVSLRATKRLMGNQVDIGNALPYYGNAATSSAPAKIFLLCVAPALVLVIRNHFKKGLNLLPQIRQKEAKPETGDFKEW